MFDFTNTLGLSSLCSIVFYQVLPDTCPLMFIERDASKTINANMFLMPVGSNGSSIKSHNPNKNFRHDYVFSPERHYEVIWE